MSLLYGIALDGGKVPAIDHTLVDAFPEYADLVGDPERRRMTVGHALTMTLGTEWDEQLDRVAGRLGTSSRSLSRWQASEGTSLASGQITLRKIDGWQSLAQPPARLDLAA